MELVRHVSCHAPSQLFNITHLIRGNEALKLQLIVGTNRIRLHPGPRASLMRLPAELFLRPALRATPHWCVSAPGAAACETFLFRLNVIAALPDSQIPRHVFCIFIHLLFNVVFESITRLTRWTKVLHFQPMDPFKTELCSFVLVAIILTRNIYQNCLEVNY